MRQPTILGLRVSVPFSLYGQRLRQHTGEELLAAAGIAVGVALVFGVLVASTSVTRSASQTIHGVTGVARLQLSARSPNGFEERLVGAVSKLPGVERSAAVLRENMAIVGPKGRDSAQLVGMSASMITLGGSSTRALSSGALPESGGLLLPTDIANAIGAKQGETVTVLSADGAHSIEVAGVLGAARFGSLASSPVAVAQMSVAQGLTGRPGRVTQVLVEPSRGADRMVSTELEKLAAGRLNVLPADSEVTLLEEAFKPSQQSTNLFALISAMVGFLLAANAMLLTVPERRRFVAELRILGYDSTQVAMILIFQALALGVFSSVAGITIGYGLSHTLFEKAPSYLSFAFPIGGHKSVSLAVLMAAFWCGIVAAVLASLPPIVELRRKQALDAVLREREKAGQSIPPHLITALGIVGVVLTGIVTLLALTTVGATVACGVVLAVAVVCLIPALYRLLLAVLGPISERVKGVFALAVIELEATATRSIALAAVAGLVVYGTIAVGGARRDVTRGVEATTAQYWSTADIWVSTGDNVFDTDTFQTKGLIPALEHLPGVAAVRPYQGGLLDVGDHRLLIRAHDPRLGAMIQSLGIIHGGVARANQLLRRGGWATVSEGFASEHHLRVGDPFTLPTPSGALHLRVAATTTNLGWAPGLIALSRLDYQRAWMTDEPSALEINLKPGVSPSAGRRAVQGVLATHPGLRAQTYAEITSEADDVLRQGLSSLAQISTLVLIIGALAIAASLSTAIWQRRVRLAAMRIWGYDRVQLWLSLLAESTILLTIGCAVGAGFGLYAHALGTRYLRLSTGFPAPFSVGSVQIIFTILLVGGISLAVVALPGMRAAQVAPTAGFQE